MMPRDRKEQVEYLLINQESLGLTLDEIVNQGAYSKSQVQRIKKQLVDNGTIKRPDKSPLRSEDDLDLKEARIIREKCRAVNQVDVAKEHNLSTTFVSQIVNFEKFEDPGYWDVLLSQPRLGCSL